MPLGKILILFGAFLIGAGLLVILSSKLHLPLGRLPGDLYIRRGNFTFSFPIATCLLLSLLLTLLFNLFFRR